MTTFVYLIHFQSPYKHARHYLGSTENLPNRLHLHRAGNGARLLEVISQAQITWRLVRVWQVPDRTFEGQLKHQKNAPRLCPICNPTNWHKHARLNHK